MTNEALVIDVVEWLEKAAHDTNLERVARRIVERKPCFVIFNIILDFVGREITGVEQVVKHPVKDFQTAVGLTDEDMGILRDFVATSVDPTIKIGFEMSENHGELLCLSQLKYVPRGTQGQAVQDVKDELAKILFLADEVTMNALPSAECEEEE